MSMENSDLPIKLYERVAVLETNQKLLIETIDNISEKLDSLLELKAKGMGAVGLVSLVVGSGILGIVYFVINFFRGGSSL